MRVDKFIDRHNLVDIIKKKEKVSALASHLQYPWTIFQNIQYWRNMTADDCYQQNTGDETQGWEKEDWGGGGGGGRESMITALKVKEMAMKFQMIHKESV